MRVNSLFSCDVITLKMDYTMHVFHRVWTQSSWLIKLHYANVTVLSCEVTEKTSNKYKYIYMYSSGHKLANQLLSQGKYRQA